MARNLHRLLELKHHQQRQQQGPGFIQTQPGDPDFSLASTPSSQAQFPAAAAEHRFYQNQRLAQNRISDAQQLGFDTTGEEFDPINQAANSGFLERAATLGENLIGWIDGPRQAVNLFMQDWAGGFAEDGKRDPNFGDYWNALWGGIEDVEGFIDETGLNPRSGSHTLDLFGWEEEEQLLPRIGRGVADFGLQVVTDPLMLVTGGLSGLGRGVAVAAGKRLQREAVDAIVPLARQGLAGREIASQLPKNSYIRQVAASLDDDVARLQDDIVKWTDKFDGEFPPEIERSLSGWLKRNADGERLGAESLQDILSTPAGNLREEVQKNIVELAVARRVGDDVLKPLASRNPGAVPGLAAEALPAYARGGLRISVPFTKRSLESGLVIPGTRGAGRKLIGDPVRKLSGHLRKFGPYQKLADNLDSAVDSFDMYRPLMKAIGKPVEQGGIESWQYWIAAPALDHVHNTGARRVLLAQLNSQMETVEELAKRNGIEDMSIIHAHMMDKLEKADVGGDAVTEILDHMGIARGADTQGLFPDDELGNAVNNLTRFIAEKFKTYHETLSVLDPSVKARWVDGYVPHTKTGGGQDILNVFSDGGIAIRRSELMQAEKDGNPGMVLLARLINAQAQGGRLETRMGATRYFTDQPGRVNVLTLADQGAMNIDQNFLQEITQDAIRNGLVDENFLQTRYLPVSQLNEILEPAVRELADRHNIVLPGNWDGKVFNDNPLEVLTEFASSMEEAIATWGFIDGLKTAGLAFRHSKALNVQDTAQAMMESAVRKTQKVKTTNWNKPVPGNNLAPMDWVNRLVDEDGLPPFRGAGDPEQIEDFITVRITDTGDPEIVDGFQLLHHARNEGFDEVEVRVVRGQSERVVPPNPDMNVSGHLVEPPDSPTVARSLEESLPQAGEEKLLRSALGEWAGDPKTMRNMIQQFAENPNMKLAGTRSRDTQRALALMRAHVRDARPWREQAAELSEQGLERAGEAAVRFTGDEPITRVSRIEDAFPAGNELQIGETFTIHMESAGVGDHKFWQKNNAFMPRSGKRKWVYEFDENTPVLPNFRNNLEESEVLVSGNFKVAAIDQDTKTIRLVYDGEALPQAAPPGKGLDPLNNPPRELHEMFSRLPWQPQAIQENRILRGFDKVSPDAIPTTVLRELGTAGLPTAKNELHLTRELFELAKMSPDDFNSLRPFKNAPNYTPPEVPTGKTFALKMDVKGNQINNIEVAFADGLDDAGRLAAREDVVASIDRALRKQGPIKPKDIRRIIQNANTNDEGAKAMRDYVRAKMNAMPDSVKEFYTGEAAEVFDTRAIYDEFEGAFNDFVKKYSFGQTPGGQLAVDTSRLRQVADDEILQELRTIKDAARRAGDAGYDEVASLMRDVDVFTSLSTMDGFVNPARFALGGPAVEDLQIHNLMARFIRNFAQNSALMYTPQGIQAAKMATNNALRNWRAMATIARPSFHIRNAVGGSWMNMLLGVGNGSQRLVRDNGIKFRNALKKPRPIGQDAVEEALKELPDNARPYFKAMWENDVLSGFTTTEFRQLTAAEKKGRMDALKVWDADNFVLQKAGGRVMESIEDFLRASLFVEYFDPANPATAKIAKEMVNAVHFDYVNLTPFETKVKSWVPFFVWTRRNLPRQLQMAVENPRTVQRYRSMMQAMNDNFGGNDETLPEGDHFSAFAAGTDYYVNENTPFWARVMIDPDLPVSDLVELPMPNGPALSEWANQLLGPHITSLFDINKQREWGDVNAPAQFVPILKGLAALGLYDETLDGDVRIPYLMRTLSETAVPFSREIIDPLTGGPTDPNRQARVGISEDDNFLESVVKNLGAIGGAGLGAKFSTPADARGAAARTKDEIDELIENLRLQGKMPPSEGR